MPEIDLHDRDFAFGSLDRDTLRRLARQHNVEGRSFGGHPVAIHESVKADLVRGLVAARRAGRLGTPATTLEEPVTIRESQRFVFLKGEGCHNQATTLCFTLRGDKLVVYSEVENDDDFMDELDDSQRFTSSVADLRAVLDALTEATR